MTRDNTPDPTETVHVDPLTELYHRDARHAGGDATTYTRPQADRFGFRRCPTCYGPAADLGGEPA